MLSSTRPPRTDRRRPKLRDRPRGSKTRERDDARAPRPDSFAGDDRAASEVVAAALLVGIVVLGVATIVLVGSSQLGESREAVEVSQAERALTQFDSEAARVATGSTTSRTVDLGLRGNSGTLDIQPESGSLRVEYADNVEKDTPTEVANTSLGTVLYENGDTTVGYQGGGVWRSDGEGSTMVSPPEITFRDETLTMPLIKSERGGSVHSDIQISSGGASERKFPTVSEENEDLTNKVHRGTLWITIESRYYKAWGQFFEDETNAEVVYRKEGEVVIVFFGSRMNFSPDAGIIATSGPGELRVEGSGSYIDSYDSSVGPYGETNSSEGAVKSAGDVLMFGGSQIYGDVEADKRVNLSGGSEITGNVSANEGWETDGASEIGGETDNSTEVPILPPIDTYVAAKTEKVARENDNDATDVITDDDALDLENGSELSPGEYYLEEIELRDGETLVLDATDGNVTIVVENYVVLDEGNIEVEGDDDGGTVRLIVASEESSGVTVPGSGGFEAEHFYVNGNSSVDVTNDAATRFQVLAPARFTGAIRASGSDDPRVTATIFAPSLGDESGEFLVRDGELFGAVVTGNFTAENNAEIHFDHAITNEEMPFGEGASLLDYLYVTEHEIEVERP